MEVSSLMQPRPFPIRERSGYSSGSRTPLFCDYIRPALPVSVHMGRTYLDVQIEEKTTGDPWDGFNVS